MLTGAMFSSRRLMVVSSLTAVKLNSFSSVACENSSTPKPVLYQYAICPFCHRVKAYLDFLKIDYTSVEVNPLTKSEIKFSNYKKVPIAVLDNKTISDSNNIIEAISKTYRNDGNIPLGFFSEDSQKWNEWSEKKLAVMLYPNITRTLKESWECFGYSRNVENWSYVERVVVRAIGSVAMSFVNGKIKTKYGIVDERKELNALLLEWSNSVSKPFLHGDSPSLPDILVYGVLSSIEGTQTHVDIMSENSELRHWYEAVQQVVTK